MTDNGDVQTMTINLAPDARVYSPHVQELKAFVEELTLLHQGYGTVQNDKATSQFIHDTITSIRAAMSKVLTDDYLLIVDGKRRPGERRND